MTECKYTSECPFFLADVGYSPELNHVMKQMYCWSNTSDCARLLAIPVVGRERIPAGMLPTDTGLLAELRMRN